jgi:hypothetical protein
MLLDRRFVCGIVIASNLFLSVTSGSSQNQAPATATRTVQFASIKDAFETDGVLDDNQVVLVQAMVESDVSLSVRAMEARVAASSIKARTYGLKFFVLRKDPEIGSAFMRRTQVYHLDAFPDRLIVDEAYWYCTGFLSSDIVKVQEKQWSKYHPANTGDVARFDTLAEAVRNGAGHQEAHKALFAPSLSPLLKTAGPEQNRFEREVTWFVGRQLIEGVGIELNRSRDLGNRVSIRFVQ